MALISHFNIYGEKTANQESNQRRSQNEIHKRCQRETKVNAIVIEQWMLASLGKWLHIS